ncbi:glycerol kinase GlpK [Chitinophaga pendula]|uniref:glycerol kinase GlpK n=1 Tax=Chitinophaga TaxID=79328 RepID=UPI000BB03A5C|nr:MULTISPECIES: glycerol kinase GlpK [Chitinophaga]ASZ11270.1 glycerol kinase [Chitinophaga sp. MD30]UCJ05730.1 glycerol kinase GlpK [Chitinophaga pendula]
MLQQPSYILSLDLGSSTAGAVLFNRQGEVVKQCQKEYEKYYPQPGWIEVDPDEIWFTMLSVIEELVADTNLKAAQIAGIGIANQRETTVIWDKSSGKPIYNAIAWQDRRGSRLCDELRYQGFAELVRGKTGLILDAYFSASKIRWILDNVIGARLAAEQGQLAFGTIDAWLIWKLTGGKEHLTEITNASRTMLFNIFTQQWDEELLRLFKIPVQLLPKVCGNSEIIAHTAPVILDAPVPIAGVAGDQHAALFGQLCFEPGTVKNTYGSGCFVLMNIGTAPILSAHNLLTTVAWKINNQVIYALEGSVFGGSSVFRWIRDGLGLIDHTAEIEDLARTEEDNGGVMFVPALSGLGAPYWDPYARGMIIGITRGTSSGHIARAALEGVALGIDDALQAMQKDTGQRISMLKVDGSSAGYDWFMQLQTNIIQSPVQRPAVMPVSALGVAYLAGLATGFWNNLNEIRRNERINSVFSPELPAESVLPLKQRWQRAIARVQQWDI